MLKKENIHQDYTTYSAGYQLSLTMDIQVYIAPHDPVRLLNQLLDLGPGPAGAWDSEKVGRPAVLYENGIYKMWYDGAANGHRHVGLATSNDGIHFTRHPNNPLFLNAGAIDVDKIGAGNFRRDL